MTDNITLPREVGEHLMWVLEECPMHGDWEKRDVVALVALREALAAPKQEPSDDDDDEEFTHEDVSTLLLEVMDWVYAKADRDRPMTEAEQKVLADIRNRLTAPKQEPQETPVPLARMPKCGFVDVRFDGEGWFCDKCGKRMSADFEASVRRGSGEKVYLELMRRKAEAVSAKSKRATP